MTADDRYDVSGLLEAQCEPGASGLVLKNLLGITSKEVMDEAEARALEQDVLRRCTPCTFADRAEVIRALAETHVELVLIHPFLDGNGRLARVLSTLMALQAGLPLLDFSLMAGTGKTAYIAAIQAGLDKRYMPMESLFGEIIERSRASS